MTLRTLHVWSYEERLGPVRNGDAHRKDAIRPNHTAFDPPVNYEDLVSLATYVIEWGNGEYANDHGSREDHELLVNFVNAVMHQIHVHYVP